jgi:hypothetical protein
MQALVQLALAANDSAVGAPLLHEGGIADEVACLGLPLLIIVIMWFATRRGNDGSEGDGPS